jgi:hypothetical protein
MRARWFGLGLAAFVPALVFACGLDDSIEVQGGPGASDGGGPDGTISGGDGSALDGSPPNDGAETSDVTTIPPVVLVYATTETELYSLDVISSTLVDIGPLANCGSPTNFADLAIDSAGAMYMLKESDAIYEIDSTGNCTVRSVLTMDNGTIDKAAGRNNGTPSVLALNGTNNDLYGVVPTNGTTTKINADIFPNPPQQTGVYDLACSKGGSCWTALASGCTPGAGSSCLYFFPDDGGVVAAGLGAIGVQPAGLAYAMGTLYSFGVDGEVTSIDLSAAPIIAKLVPTHGASLPPTWTGAASAANY